MCVKNFVFTAVEKYLLIVLLLKYDRYIDTHFYKEQIYNIFNPGYVEIMKKQIYNIFNPAWLCRDYEEAHLHLK